MLNFDNKGEFAARALKEIGHIYRRKKEFEKAAAYYQRVMDECPDQRDVCADAYTWTGKICLRQKENEKSSSKSPLHKELSPIDVDLVLAPVSGIPVFELEIGDKIMVKLTDRSTKGNYLIDHLGARVDGTLIPVPAEVIDIEKGEENEYTILCRLGDDAYGKAVETEQVKLKRYDELLGETSSDELPSLDGISGKRKFPLFLAVTGGLMLAVLIVFFIMWFYNVL